MNTTETLCALIELLAAHTNRAASTVSRLCTGSGDTYRRLSLRGTDGLPAHRISTDRVEAAFHWMSMNWPDDLEWPRSIPRPSKRKGAA